MLHLSEDAYHLVKRATEFITAMLVTTPVPRESENPGEQFSKTTPPSLCVSLPTNTGSMFIMSFHNVGKVCAVEKQKYKRGGGNGSTDDHKHDYSGNAAPSG